MFAKENKDRYCFKMSTAELVSWSCYFSCSLPSACLTSCIWEFSCLLDCYTCPLSPASRLYDCATCVTFTRQLNIYNYPIQGLLPHIFMAQLYLNLHDQCHLVKPLTRDEKICIKHTSCQTGSVSTVLCCKKNALIVVSLGIWANLSLMTELFPYLGHWQNMLHKEHRTLKTRWKFRNTHGPQKK